MKTLHHYVMLAKEFALANNYKEKHTLYCYVMQHYIKYKQNEEVNM